MIGKRCGGMTFRARISLEIQQSGIGWMIAGGVLTGLSYIVMRSLCESPYRMMLELGIQDLIPPVWLMSLLRFLSFLTAGCAAGLVFGYRNLGCAAEKYKGCLLFLITILLELFWYPALFVKGTVFLSLLISILMLAFAVAATVCFLRISKFAGIIMILHDCWLVYLLLLTCSVFFRN